MLVAVMRIRKVRVGMGCGLVLVRMRMRAEKCRYMFVQMMAVGRGVFMRMFMRHEDMSMPVAVVFGQVQPDAGCHQRRRCQQGPGHRLGKENNGNNCPDKGRR